MKERGQSFIKTLFLLLKVNFHWFLFSSSLFCSVHFSSVTDYAADGSNIDPLIYCSGVQLQDHFKNYLKE